MLLSYYFFYRVLFILLISDSFFLILVFRSLPLLQEQYYSHGKKINSILIFPTKTLLFRERGRDPNRFLGSVRPFIVSMRN
jgi:hypothetical protein